MNRRELILGGLAVGVAMTLAILGGLAVGVAMTLAPKALGTGGLGFRDIYPEVPEGITHVTRWFQFGFGWPEGRFDGSIGRLRDEEHFHEALERWRVYGVEMDKGGLFFKPFCYGNDITPETKEFMPVLNWDAYWPPSFGPVYSYGPWGVMGVLRESKAKQITFRSVKLEERSIWVAEDLRVF